MAPRHGMKFLFSCFKSSKVSDFDQSDQAITDGAQAPRRRSKFWFSNSSEKKKKKKKTESPFETSDKLIKDKKDKPSTKNKQQPASTTVTRLDTPKATASPTAVQRNTTVQCSSRTISPSLLFVSSRERTATAKVHAGMSQSPLVPRPTSKKSKHKTAVSLTPDSSISILLLSLVATVIFGRAFAVLLVCIWLYLMRLLISSSSPATVIEKINKLLVSILRSIRRKLFWKACLTEAITSRRVTVPKVGTQ